MDFDRSAVMKTFLAETAESLAAMEEALLRLETQPADRECLHNIFRRAHSLKGNAASLDLGSIAVFAHGLEDLLEKLRDKEIAATPDLITLLLRVIDALRVMSKAAVPGQNDPSPEYAGLLEQVRHLQQTAGNDVQPKAKIANGGSPKGDGKGSAAATTLRVGIDKLDRLVNLTGEMAIARGRLDLVLQRGEKAAEALAVHREADTLYSELQELVMRLRMVPLGPTFAQLARTVRDLARNHGKLVCLETSGEDVELDTRVIELIRDPLIHLVRNAVDHGIELPDVRQAAGKNRCGLIHLHAGHEGGNVLIQVSDDGAGFDRAHIIKRARELRLLDSSEHVTDSDLNRIVFEPGFSTRTEVTQLSGRGMGMDVVRRNTEMLRGSVSLRGAAGGGLEVSMRIPLTLAIIDGFAVQVGGETYVIPLDCVLECFEMREAQQQSDDGGVVELRGKPLAFLRLRGIFGMGSSRPAREHVVVVRREAESFGLVVDSLQGEIQAVVKPLGRTFAGATDFSGSTILGDGRVALLLDVSRLAQRVLRPQVWRRGGEGEKLAHWNTA